jgi:serine/threonine protein kinase/serine phosphatase RsbU (regulator of sigma subunit)
MIGSSAKQQTHISSYRIEERIAQTASSDVYKASLENKSYCIKVLRTVDEFSETFQLFKKEAKLLASVDHPNVLKVVDYGTNHSQQYICTEYIEGNDLDKHIKNKSLTLEQKMSIMISLASGLEAIHEAGIIHRDLKPMNVMVEIADKVHVTIADLGMANEFSSVASSYSGTIDYSPPEQLGLINSNVTCVSDLYSLGVIFYELFVGEVPFQVSEGEIAGNLTEEKNQKLLNCENLPPIIQSIIKKLVQGNPAHRYQTASGLLYDLKFAIQKHKEGDSNPKIILDQKSNKSSLSTKVFVGREKEIAFLEKIFLQKKKQKFHIITVGGVAGVGKSSLITEMQNQSALDGALLCYGKSYEFASGIPYNSLSEALANLYEKIVQLPEHKKNKIISGIRTAVGSLGSELVGISPIYKNIIEIKEAVSVLSPDQEKFRLAELLKNFFEAISQEIGSLVIFLDDLQWADKSTIDLLKNFLASPPHCPLMIVGSYRSEAEYYDKPFRPLIEDMGEFDIQLSPFNQDECRLMIARSLSVDESLVSEGLAQFVYEKTSGNPLFISELLKKLCLEGVLKTNSNRLFTDVSQLQEINLPSSVSQLVINRVKNFPEDIKHVISYAAVIGVSFNLRLLSRVTGRAPEAVYNILEYAVSQQIFKRLNDGEYSFFHDKIYESCLSLVDTNERQAIHKSIVEYLEKQDDGYDIFNLAEHSIKSMDSERVIKYATEAGILSLKKHSLEKAEYYLSSVIASIGESYQDEYLKAYISLSEVYMGLGQYDKSNDLLQKLLSFTNSSRENKVIVLTKLAECVQRSGDYKTARTYLVEALNQLDLKFDCKYLTIKNWLDSIMFRLLNTWVASLFITQNMVAKYSLAADVLRKLWMVQVILDMTPLLHISYRMLKYSSIANNPQLKSVAHQYLSFSLMNLLPPQSEKAFYHAKKSIQIAKQCGETEVVAGSMVRLAAYHNWLGKYEESKSYADEARDTLIATGNLWDVGNAIIFSFFANKALGKLQQAVSDAYSLRQLGEKTKSNGMLASGTCKVAEVALLRGRGEEFDTLIKDGIELVDRCNLSFDKFQMLKAKGMGDILRGNYDQARKSFVAAIEIIEQGGASFFKAYISAAYLGYCESVFLSSQITTDMEEFQLATQYLQDCRNRESYYSEMGYVERCAGLMYAKLCQNRKARDAFEASIKVYEIQKRPLELALARIDFANAVLAIEPDMAKEHLMAALQTLETYKLSWQSQKAYQVGKKLGLTFNEDSQGSEKSRRLEEVLVEIGTASTKSLDLKKQSTSILDKIIEVINADRALLFFESDSSLEFYLGRTRDQEYVDKATNFSSSFVNRLRTSKESLIMTGSGDDDLNPTHSVVANNLLSIMGAPIYSDGCLRGVLYVDSKVEKGLYSRNDAQLLWSISQQLGISLKIQEMADIEVKSAMLEKDLELAGVVQSLLLPKYQKYDCPQFELHSYYQAAAQTSGDWWWHHQVSADRHIVLMGDVTGHGAGAAMVTAYTSGVANMILKSQPDPDPKSFLETLNQQIYNACSGKFNMTVNLADFNFKTGQVDFWFAGGPAVLVFDKGEDLFISERSSILGNEKVIFRSDSLKMESGMKIIIYSDGLTEAPMKSGQMLMERRLVRLLKKFIDQKAELALNSLMNYFNEHRQPGELADDVSVLYIEIK